MALLFFVGSNEQALKYKRVNTQMIDALGKAMVSQKGLLVMATS